MLQHVRVLTAVKLKRGGEEKEREGGREGGRGEGERGEGKTKRRERRR